MGFFRRFPRNEKWEGLIITLFININMPMKNLSAYYKPKHLLQLFFMRLKMMHENQTFLVLFSFFLSLSSPEHGEYHNGRWHMKTTRLSLWGRNFSCIYQNLLEMSHCHTGWEISSYALCVLKQLDLLSHGWSDFLAEADNWNLTLKILKFFFFK